ncbi:MAG TPA: TIGR02281 family clan AA aspartic protease [Bauldia sp.]|nr:TIGR02281 family clan AA aspartic protease [Bauldia sp.]
MAGPASRRPQFILWILLAALIALVISFTSQDASGKTFGLDNHDLLQLGYLLIILIFVGSALLGRGLGAGEIVRATAGWLAVLLFLVGAYAYRSELTGVGARMLGVLAPGVPISGKLAGEADDAVVIARGIDGHFGVRAKVQDVPMMMLVDTGASFVTLTQADAKKIGIDPGDLHFSLPIRTANGMIQAAPVTIAKLAVGSIERKNVAALVAPARSLDQSLLGMSFLNTLDGYAISGDRMVLTP